MRFVYLGIASSSTLALRVNLNSKNPGCVHNVDDCSSLNGNCCANQEMCGVQECFKFILNSLTPIWGISGTSGSVISGQKIRSYFFGFDDVIPDRKFFVS